MEKSKINFLKKKYSWKLILMKNLLVKEEELIVL
jgi:hypothetical protein